jgi:hypothetical protein
VFKTWILNESGDSSGVEDLAGEIDARVARLVGASGPVPFAQAPKLTCIEGVESNVVPAPGDAVVFIARAKPSGPLHAAAWWNRFQAVIPVIDKAGDAKKYLPPCLQHRNALVTSRYRRYWTAVAADALVAHAALPRVMRRVFISYKRDESIGVARQLRQRLSSEGFEVFLDEQSIEHGALFAREIAYRLTDADLVVVLATGGIAKSRWVSRELRLAERAGIGVIAVEWPPAGSGDPLLRTLMPDQVFRVSAPLKSRRDVLSRADLKRLVPKLYDLRVAAVAQRVQGLVPAAAIALANRHPGETLTPGRRLGEIVSRNARNRETELLVVMPFRPTVRSLWETCSVWKGVRDVRFVYREAVPRDPRVRSLRWAIQPHQPGIVVEHV